MFLREGAKIEAAMSMKSDKSWIRRSRRLIRMVSELHRMGYQRLRMMPYEYPLAWRLCLASSKHFSLANGAYISEPELVRSVTYSSASENEYFNWPDAKNDDARALADKFLARYPEIAEESEGRDWLYAGWLAELLGFLQRGDLLPFIMSEDEPSPEQLKLLPVRDFNSSTILEFPLPPSPS
jgi:hypothetical protein